MGENRTGQSRFETYVGGLAKNKHGDRKLRAGRGTVGKTPMVGLRDRPTRSVHVAVVPDNRQATLQAFVRGRLESGARLYTNEAAAYQGLPALFYRHESVQHSVSEYVRDMAHTNGMESFWSMLKRGYIGVYHKISPKHLDRYVAEFSGRHNLRRADTRMQMARVVEGMVGKRLRYHMLIADNGLASGARS